ncbi:oxidoreductase [Kitasatospora sp. NPDC002227]|uniref:oxidoreductase n=1 Tax=Kitasatospora sp. NPDC002227 TaxID=3154773 RepID=UPI00331C217C
MGQVSEAPDDLNEAERRLWRAFCQGEVLDLSSGGDEVDDILAGPDWPEERVVRAEVLAMLLLGSPTPAPGRVTSLRLTGAYVSGHLNLAGGVVPHYVELRHCRFERKILMSEARVGTFRLVSCLIPRLEASRLVTEGDLHLPRCVIPGGVRLTDARIGTDLLVNQMILGCDSFGRAFAGDGLTVHQDVEAERIEAHGEFAMRSARIGGRLTFRGSQLYAPAPRTDRNCLNLARITVGNTLYLAGSLDGGWTTSRTIYGYGYGGYLPDETSTTPMRAYGGVRLVDARFEAACVINRVEFHLGPEQELSLRRIKTPELRFTCPAPTDGKVSFSRAQIGNLVDAPESWPRNGRVGLTGFTYESLRSEVPFTVEQRIDWLNDALRDYHPEPYEQLAATLRGAGRDEDAREVLYAKQRRRRSTLPLPGRIWGRLQDATVGYGYRPGRAAAWLALAWALGGIYFRGHQPPPLKADEIPTWDPWLYSLSKVIPLVNLGQDGWNPHDSGQWVATALVVAGWVLATTVVAGATRMLQRG